MAEKPPKRRMSSFGPDEPSIRSLKTELEFLQKRHVAALKEHSVVQSRYLKNTDKLEKENRALKKERFELGEKLKRTEDATRGPQHAAPTVVGGTGRGGRGRRGGRGVRGAATAAGDGQPGEEREAHLC